jgi:hypothetical protein
MDAKDVPLLNRSPHSGGCSSYQRILSSYQSLVPGFMDPARPETEPPEGALFFNDEVQVNRIVKCIGNGGPHGCVFYKRFQDSTRHISLDAHAHCDGFKTKRLGVRSPVPHSAALRFPRRFRSQSDESE